MLVTEGVGYAAEALDAANRGQRVRQRRAAADPALGAGGRQLASEIALCDRRKPFGSVPCRRTFAMRALHRSCKAKRLAHRCRDASFGDRKSVGQGKSVAVRVVLGCRRILNKKRNTNIKQ